MRVLISLVSVIVAAACTSSSTVEENRSQYVAMNLAAHPDDEDGATMHYLRHAKDVVVHSVIFTRGEGGQNEIGPELYEALGAIRSAETEAAARHLGTQVHFLKFKDFGYSKTAAETFARWGGEDSVTAALVYMIRSLKPDVIFTNHDTVTTGLRRQHGHHQAVGVTAYRAFELSADPTYRVEQLRESGVDLWQPARLFLRRFGSGGPSDAVLPVGDTRPATGESYAAGAAEALGYHASQGMDQFAARVRQIDSMHFSMLRAVDSVKLPLTDLFYELDKPEDRALDITYLIDSGRSKAATFEVDDSLAIPGQVLTVSWKEQPAENMRWEFSGAVDTTTWLSESGIRLRIPDDAAATRPAKIFQYDRRKNHPPIVYAAYGPDSMVPVVAGYLPVEIAAPLYIEPSTSSVRLKPGHNEIGIRLHAFDPNLRDATIETTVTVAGRTVAESAHEVTVGKRGTLLETVPLLLPQTLPSQDYEITLSAGTNQARLMGRAFTTQ